MSALLQRSDPRDTFLWSERISKVYPVENLLKRSIRKRGGSDPDIWFPNVGTSRPTNTKKYRGETLMDDNREYGWSWWYLLLLAQFIPTLWVPFYNSFEPSWGGIPFFYWFQMALVFVSAAVTAVVYFATERAR
jgi:Protein of unknown function (DUF3311)